MQYGGTRHRQHRSQGFAAESLLAFEESPPPTPGPPWNLSRRSDYSPKHDKTRAGSKSLKAAATDIWQLSTGFLSSARFFRSDKNQVFHVGPRATSRWKKSTISLFLATLISGFYFVVVSFKHDTLVFQREDLQRIWRWEVANGHFPSRQPIPSQIKLQESPQNPALAPQRLTSKTDGTNTLATGAKREYLSPQASPESVGFPPRPVPGCMIDFDEILRHCAYEAGKDVPDCLEVLRVGAGLDNGRRIHRGPSDNWKYLYVEVNETSSFPNGYHAGKDTTNRFDDPNEGLRKHAYQDWESPSSQFKAPIIPYTSPSTSPNQCHPDYPRTFHSFWKGTFTDKPYLILLSFLFTQRTGLHIPVNPSESPCRPQFWMWIDAGISGHSLNHEAAEKQMLDVLMKNPWAAPFLHPRFNDIIKFKLWNTAQQLDSIPEIRHHWRTQTVFRSNLKQVKAPDLEAELPIEGEWAASSAEKKNDHLSVTLSDMVRFLLCHRYGGIYLDADTVLLRDWEELWVSKAAFAYRWSKIPRYNTAVLRLNKNSALGTFILRTAVKNDFDFHPATITRYMKDAHLHDLLMELPDALFDPAWLGIEGWQNRLPQPAFEQFLDFFEKPSGNVAAPKTLGFEGFFRGAYSYHYHNLWWKPVDSSRNWPDLGSRFVEGEQLVRNRLDVGAQDDNASLEDLAWVTVLKRIMESYIRGERPNMYGEMLEW